MTTEQYNKAKQLMEEIEVWKSKQSKIKKMKERPNDEEFTFLRSLSFDGLTHAIEQHEKEFKNL